MKKCQNNEKENPTLNFIKKFPNKMPKMPT